MKKKLLGGLLAITTITALSVAAAPIIGNQTQVLRAAETYNTTVNIECPFGTADGSKYLTITQNDSSVTLGVSDSPLNQTIQFDYTSGTFKFPLNGGFINFKNPATIKYGSTAGTTFEYKIENDTYICSGSNAGYLLVIHNSAATYSQTTDYSNYIPLIPHYSAEQYTGWYLNCSGHRENFTQSAKFLYNLVVNKNDVNEEYKPQEDTPIENISVLTFTAKCNGKGTADDGTNWTITSDGTESNFDGTKGIHYGTNNAQVGYIRLSTSNITNTINKIVVNASTASGVTASVSIAINGNAFGETQSLSSTAKDYTFVGTASGEIVVQITKPSKAAKALYCKSITVCYNN